MISAPELPECLSIVFCDQIYRDEVTKKLIIVGVFNVIRAESFPCSHQSMSVLFTLTNGHGEYDLCLSIENAKTGCPVAEVKGPLKLIDPLQIVDFNVELGKLTFSEPGKYWVCIKFGEETVRQRPFFVEQIKVQT